MGGLKRSRVVWGARALTVKFELRVQSAGECNHTKINTWAVCCLWLFGGVEVSSVRPLVCGRIPDQRRSVGKVRAGRR